jgi:hypothetical protein
MTIDHTTYFLEIAPAIQANIYSLMEEAEKIDSSKELCKIITEIYREKHLIHEFWPKDSKFIQMDMFQTSEKEHALVKKYCDLLHFEELGENNPEEFIAYGDGHIINNCPFLKAFRAIIHEPDKYSDNWLFCEFILNAKIFNKDKKFTPGKIYSSFKDLALAAIHQNDYVFVNDPMFGIADNLMGEQKTDLILKAIPTNHPDFSDIFINSIEYNPQIDASFHQRKKIKLN